MTTQLQTQTKAAPQPSFTPVQTGLLQRKCPCGQHTIAGGECEECHQKHDGTMQRAAVSSTPTNAVPPIVHDVLSSSGQSLDAGTRAFMEPRFGHDFSQVRVHTDNRAEESARAVNALAYTMGRDVVFGEKQYAAGTSVGRRLLAHELTHVVQQNSMANSSWIAGIGQEGDRYEIEAEERASAISNALPEVTTRPPESPVVQRAPLTIMKQGAPAAPPKAVDIRDVEIQSRGRTEHIDPSKVTLGIWWFNGATPLFSVLYPNEVELESGLPASGRFQYKVTKGKDKLTLLDGTRETGALDAKDNPAPKVRGKGPSKAPKDIELSITHTPPGAKSSSTLTVDLKVRAPGRLELLGCSHAAQGAFGYETAFQMKVLDNFGVAMPYIDVNEDFDPGTLAPSTMSEWDAPIKARRKGSSVTLGDAIFEDHYAVGVSGGTPPTSMSPQPSNPQSPLGSALAATFNHKWYVGSESTGQGVHVSTHLGKLYGDHGQYSNFTSPVSARGKATSCPLEAAPKAVPLKKRGKTP